MKRPFLILCLTLIVVLGSGQEAKNSLFYSNVGVNIGNYYGFQVGLNYVSKSNYIFGIAYFDHEKKPMNRPEDYSIGFISLFDFGQNTARDHLRSYLFTGGYLLNTQNKNIRWCLTAGLAFSVFSHPTGWEKINDNLFPLTENYSYTVSKSKAALGLIINPKLEWAFFKYFGISAGPYLILNAKSNSFGIEFNYLIGQLIN